MVSDEMKPEPDGGPLVGVRVLDLTRVIMGPFATQILADQGADVILVEPSDGDINRELGAGPHPQLAGTTLNLLRNKRSVELDLKTAEDRRRLERIVRTCDVLVTSLRPDALRRLGADYESVRRIGRTSCTARRRGSPLGAIEPTTLRMTTSSRPHVGCRTSWSGCGGCRPSCPPFSPTRCVGS